MPLFRTRWWPWRTRWRTWRLPIWPFASETGIRTRSTNRWSFKPSWFLLRSQLTLLVPAEVTINPFGSCWGYIFNPIVLYWDRIFNPITLMVHAEVTFNPIGSFWGHIFNHFCSCWDASVRRYFDIRGIDGWQLGACPVKKISRVVLEVDQLSGSTYLLDRTTGSIYLWA